MKKSSIFAVFLALSACFTSIGVLIGGKIGIAFNVAAVIFAAAALIAVIITRKEG